jgi:peroxiredoxin
VQIWLIFGSALWAIVGQATPAAGSPRPDARVEDYALGTLHGHACKLSDWQDHQYLVVVFLAVDCPLTKSYAPRLGAMWREFESRGVAFVGINSNLYDDDDAIDRYVSRHQIPFQILRGTNRLVEDRLGATRTPEVFVLDQDRVVRYRGRIDDQYAPGIQRPQATHHDLVNALEDLLAGRPVRVPATEPAGCVIDRSSAPNETSPVTYSKDVAPILQQRCVVCHRPGNIGPFPLRTYEETTAWGGMIGEVVETGRMPPWSASPAHGRFANDPRLSEKEKRVIVEWLRNGCPRGEDVDLPKPRVFSGGWQLPKPDLVLSMPHPFTIPPEGTVEYQYFELDPGFGEDRWLRGVEIRPSNRAVVHHCNLFIRAPTDLAPEVQQDSEWRHIAVLAPGTPPFLLPEGMAKRVPAGWRFVLVVHYTTVGSIQTDQTRVGFVLTEPRQVRQEVLTDLTFDPNLCIPPGAANHRVEHACRMEKDVRLLALFPHMHLRGKAFRCEAVYPSGEREILLDVPRYDFGWQHRYELAEPKFLPAGTVLHYVAHYDNSANNPANPNPGFTVRTGRQSWDEMFNAYIEIVVADQDLTRAGWWTAMLEPLRNAPAARWILPMVLALGTLLFLRRRDPLGVAAKGEIPKANLAENARVC